MTSPFLVSADRFVPADAATVFEVLADPTKHPAIDGSGSVKRVSSSQPRLALGVEFGADMRIGLPYRVTNRVVEFEEGRRIAWRHFGGHRWRYVLTPEPGGTTVREEWDATRLPRAVQLGFRLARVPQRNRRSIEATLDRLASYVS
jgi:hypothetical protein